MTIARVGRAAAAERQFARSGRAAAERQFASLSGARAYLPKFSTVALGSTVLVVGGGLAYDRWMTKMHHSEIIWHGSDRGALPPTEQRFFPPEERGEMPRLMRIWRTTEADGFNREADTDQVAAEGQQPTV
jgi:hypothetical protein